MNSFFKGKPVLITGAAGFIGSHLTRKLLSEKAVINVLLKNDSNTFRIRDIIEKVTLWYGDIRDYSTILRCITKSRPQFIFHLAAFTNVRRDLELLEPMVDINIRGTTTLLKVVTESNINLERFINTGSSEEYGDGAFPFRESQKEKPVSPYSASKVATTYFCQMFYKTMNLPVVTLRPFLTYGPYQDTDMMFIPSLISHCLEGKNFPMTEGDQTREFNYVDDIVDAYLLAACCPEAEGEVINIGNGIEYRIRDVAEKIVRIMGNPIELKIGALPKRPGETEHFFCKNEKAKKLLGWLPKINLDEGLKKTISWYKKYSFEKHI